MNEGSERAADAGPSSAPDTVAVRERAERIEGR